MASLCKVLWILQDHTIPPNVGINQLNQKIKWKQWKLRVPLETEAIKARHESGRLLISLNSSGIGGSNAHVVVESYKPASNSIRNEIPSNYPALLLAGGLSETSANTIAKQLATLADGNKDIGALTLYFGRRAMQMNWRSFSVMLPGATPSFSSPRFRIGRNAKLVFVLSGQGPQHINSNYLLISSVAKFRSDLRLLQWDDNSSISILFFAQVYWSLIQYTEQ